LIEGLSSWFTIPQHILDRIERLVSNIHNASLLIDDIEDGSPLRRGKPAAYRVFGRAQTINSANFLWVLASEETFQLNKHSQKVVVGS
jgi:geranylgeranyl pyrophosphate synthase